MKRILLIAFAVAAFLAAGKLLAQNVIQATVPFDFYVGNSALPSGTYRIAPCADHVLMVRHCTQGIAVMHLTVPSGTPPPEDNGKLVFHRYGEQYFLSEVQGLPTSGNLSLPMSSREKSVRAEKATVRTFETITVPKPAETQPPQ